VHQKRTRTNRDGKIEKRGQKKNTFTGEETRVVLFKTWGKKFYFCYEKLASYDQSLEYLEKWFDFGGNNCLYKFQFLWLKTESTQNFKAIRPSSVLVSQ